MFSYLRYFAIISFIMVILAALGFGVYFRSQASEDLQRIAQTNNIALAQSFINVTWKKHLPSLSQLRAFPPSLWARYTEFRDFTVDTFRHFEGVPITQLNIYTGDGTLVASISRDAEISYNDSPISTSIPEDAESRKLFDQAKAGNISSRVVEDASIKMPSGKAIMGTVVQTIIPILPENYSSVIAGATAKPEGFIEVVYDINSQWKALNAFQFWVTGGIIVLFVVLLATLLLVAKRAESIISTQHEANVELAATAAKAEAESRQKSQFLANVSHELRTPLNAIIGFSEIIKNQVMGPLENTQYMNYINDIHSSGVHLLSLINDILDFSKAEAGKLELQLSELDATKLIQNCMRLVSPRAEQAQVQLQTSLPKEHFIITGDAKKLKQVMLNLLSNSVKFTPEQGTVKVTAWQNVMDDSISIEVQDSGIGISPKDISRAMSPFGQVDSKLSRKYEGTGLGLPLTKKFVEIMGGTFKIESELEVGTTITITIPLTPPKHVVTASNQNRSQDDANASYNEKPAPIEKQISPQLMQSSKLELALDRGDTEAAPTHQPPIASPAADSPEPPVTPEALSSPPGILRVEAQKPELDTTPTLAPQPTPHVEPPRTDSSDAPSIEGPPPTPPKEVETLQPTRLLTDVQMPAPTAAPAPAPASAPTPASPPAPAPVNPPPPSDSSSNPIPAPMINAGSQAPSAPTAAPPSPSSAPAASNPDDKKTTTFASYDALRLMAQKQGMKPTPKPKKRALPESTDSSEF